MTLLPLVVAIRPAGKMEKNLLHADGLSLPPPLVWFAFVLNVLVLLLILILLLHLNR